MSSRSLTLLFLLLPVAVAPVSAQSCNIGYEDVTGFDNTNSPFAENYLVGTRYSLETVGVLNSINLVGRNTGAQVQMAVYTDLNDQPGTLLAVSGIGTVGEGVISFPVSPLQLQPGLYWILAIYDTPGAHSYVRTTPEGRICSFKMLPFGSAIPGSGAGFSSYIGTDFSYFLGISCGNLGNPDYAYEGLHLYPNPVEDILHLSLPSGRWGAIFQLINIYGATVSSGKCEATGIDVHNLAPGVYMLKLEGAPTLRFIKK